MLSGLSESKPESLGRVRSFYPDVARMLSRMNDDGRTEPLILTEYHRPFVMPNLEIDVF